jgi:hypothetical protein
MTFAMIVVIIALAGSTCGRAWPEGSVPGANMVPRSAAWATAAMPPSTVPGGLRVAMAVRRNPRSDWRYFTSGHPAPVDAGLGAVRRTSGTDPLHPAGERRMLPGGHSGTLVPGRSDHERMIYKTMPCR